MAKRARPKTAERKTRKPERSVVAPPAPAVSPTPRMMPTPAAPDAGAVSLFQQAMESLQRKQYGAAADGFRAVLDRFPGERALADRSRVYLDLAQRELTRQEANPRTIEERVTAATAALNNDQDAEAERLVRSVLADDARHDLALYLMAALEARRGDTEAALTFLGRAIGVSPEVRAQARHDADFETLRPLEAFQLLVEPPTGAATAAPRKPLRRLR
jgi:tetratricopeptide (TPR) repeat protein